MSKNIIIYRLKQNKFFLIAIFISLILLEYSYQSTMSFGYENADNALDLFLYTLASGLASWLGLLFPMVAALPYAATYVREYKTGYLKCKLMRMGKFNYFCGKLLATFFYGGFALAVPVGIYALQIGLSHKTTAPLGGENGQTFVSYMIDFAKKNPGGYMALSVAIVFVCGAVFSVFAMGISAWVKNEFLTIILPFALCILVAIVSPFASFNFLLLFCPSEYSFVQTWQLIAMAGGLLIAGILLFVFGVIRNEKE